MARKFFYVCAGLLMLALAWHLGARSAVAQAPSNSVVAMHLEPSGQGPAYYVATANGDLYAGSPGTGFVMVGNVFTSTTPARESTLGAVKARYR